MANNLGAEVIDSFMDYLEDSSFGADEDDNRENG